MYVYATTYKHPDGRLSYYVGKHERPYEKSKWYLGSGDFCKNFREKYGAEYTKKNVVKKILMHSLPNRKTLIQWEKIFIASYQQIYGSLCKNNAKGGEGFTGSHTQEAKDKISEAVKERWRCGEYKTKKSKEVKERWDSPEYKAKVSKAIKKAWESPEYKAKMSKMLSETRKGENNPNYKVNSVKQVLERILVAEDVDIKITTFRRALKNAKHKKHAEYTELLNKYKVEEK